jgi:hypothetical protein
MAVPKWPSRQLLGPFAFEASLTAPTQFYIYAVGVSDGEMATLIGWRKKDGSVQAGALVKAFQGVGASNNAIDVTAATAEIDTDTASPYFGYVRLKVAMAATAS